MATISCSCSKTPTTCPRGDLLADLQGVVPPGTDVVVNHVSGERYLLGTVA